MAPPWSNLVEILNETQQCLRSFSFLLMEEEGALRGMERGALGEIASKKEQVLESLSRYDQQVQSGLEQLSSPLGGDRLFEWLNRAAQPEAAIIYARLGDLRSLAQQVRDQGKKNEALIYRMQAVVGQAIHLIYSGLGKGPVYQSSGGLRFPEAPGSVHIHG